MKRMTFAVAAITGSLAVALPAVADDAHHPERAAAQKTDEQASQAIRGMQENVRKMRVQLERAAKARSDGERQQALAEHMQTMRDNMRMAHGMQGGMAMECPMMGKGMGMMGDQAPAAAPADRLLQLEKRMDIMEQRLKQSDGAAAPMPMK